MRRPRLSVPVIATTALALVDREGFEQLSLSAVAEDLDVGPSALYGHVDGLDGLRYLVAVAATDNLTDAVRTAAVGTSGPRALTAMGGAYRTFSLEHAGQFASTLLPPRSDTDQLAAANRSLLDVFVLVYSAMGLDQPAAHLAARSTRSAIHGFLALEHISGTTSSHSDEYAHLLSTIQRGVLEESAA